MPPLVSPLNADNGLTSGGGGGQRGAMETVAKGENHVLEAESWLLLQGPCITLTLVKVAWNTHFGF